MDSGGGHGYLGTYSRELCLEEMKYSEFYSNRLRQMTCLFGNVISLQRRQKCSLFHAHTLWNENFHRGNAWHIM